MMAAETSQSIQLSKQLSHIRSRIKQNVKAAIREQWDDIQTPYRPHKETDPDNIKWQLLKRDQADLETLIGRARFGGEEQRQHVLGDICRKFPEIALSIPESSKFLESMNFDPARPLQPSSIPSASTSEPVSAQSTLINQNDPYSSSKSSNTDNLSKPLGEYNEDDDEEDSNYDLSDVQPAAGAHEPRSNAISGHKRKASDEAGLEEEDYLLQIKEVQLKAELVKADLEILRLKRKMYAARKKHREGVKQEPVD